MKIMQRGFVRNFWIVVVISLLAGCQGYRDGSSRTFGQVTDDAGIRAAVKTALIRDKEIKGLAIDVRVNRSVVSLYGRVPTAQARARAIEISAGVKGVAEVQDRLTLIAVE